MGFFSFVKKIGRGIKSGVKAIGRVAHKGFDYAKKGVDWVKRTAGRVGKIPIVGDIAKKLVDIPIPLIGNISARQAFNKVDGAVQTGHKISSGADKFLNHSSGEQQGNAKDIFAAAGRLFAKAQRFQKMKGAGQPSRK